MNNPGGDNVFVLISMFGIAFLIMYFLMIRPRRKKEKEIEQLRSQLRVGDIVTTIGGIVGIVVSVKEDGLTLETGTDRNRIRVKKWAIQTVEQVSEGGSGAVVEGSKNEIKSDKNKEAKKEVKVEKSTAGK